MSGKGRAGAEKNDMKKKNNLYAFIYTALLIIFTMLADVAGYAEESLGIALPISQNFYKKDGSLYQTNARVEYTLIPLESGNPMPAGSADNRYKVTLSGNEDTETSKLTFLTPGIYSYEYSTSKTPTEFPYTWEDETYTVTIYVKNNFSHMLIISNGDGNKVSKLSYEYTKKDSGKPEETTAKPTQPTTGDDGRDDPDPTPSPTAPQETSVPQTSPQETTSPETTPPETTAPILKPLPPGETTAPGVLPLPPGVDPYNPGDLAPGRYLVTEIDENGVPTHYILEISDPNIIVGGIVGGLASTGDNSYGTLWVITAVVSLLGIVVLVLAKRRNRIDEAGDE